MGAACDEKAKQCCDLTGLAKNAPYSDLVLGPLFIGFFFRFSVPFLKRNCIELLLFFCVVLKPTGI